MNKRTKLLAGGETDAAARALRDQARAAGSDAMAALVGLATDANSEAVKLAAIKELLDRGFGRPTQGDHVGAVIAHLVIDDGYPD